MATKIAESITSGFLKKRNSFNLRSKLHWKKKESDENKMGKKSVNIKRTESKF